MDDEGKITLRPIGVVKKTQALGTDKSRNTAPFYMQDSSGSCNSQPAWKNIRDVISFPRYPGHDF